jgi:WD40 repeat protein
LTERQTVKTFHIETGAETLICTLPGAVRDLSYSRDGEWLAVLTVNPDFVTLRRANDGGVIMDLPLPKDGGAFFNNVRMSPDKQRLYVSCGAFAKPNLRCLTIPDAGVIWENHIGVIDDSDENGKSDIGFSAMDLSPDGHTLVVATGVIDRQLRVLESASGRLLQKLSGHTGFVLQIAFSPDGSFLASTSQDQTVRLWDTATWRRRAAPLRGHNHEVNALAISNATHLVASGNKEGELLLWDTQIRRPASGRRSLPPHIEIAKTLPVSRMVVGRGVDGKWSLIDLLTMTEEPLPDPRFPSPDEYPGLTPKRRAPLVQELDGVRLGLNQIAASALSPDGKLLAVGTDFGLVGLYEPATLKKIDILRSNHVGICGVAFSPDNLRLVLASHGEHGIALWDTATRQEVLTLSSPDALLYSVEFTDDGSTLLAGSKRSGSNQKGSCQFWQAPSWLEIEDTERADGRWSQTASPKIPPPAPTYAELKVLIEQGYREKLVAPRTQSAADLALWDGNLTNLADFLRQQRRDEELEPLLRAHLENLRQRTPRNDEAVSKAATNLLRTLLSLIHKKGDPVAPDKMGSYEQQADGLVAEVLEMLAHSSLSDPNDTILSLWVTALQIWFGKDADHLATCRRLLEQAEQKPNDPYMEERAARAWYFGFSSEPALLAQTLRLARQAARQEMLLPQRAWYQQTLGMGEFLAGNDAAAEQALLRAEESSELSSYGKPYLRTCIEGTARLFRVMILIRQGKQADAQKLFTEVEAKMRPLPADSRQVLLNGATQDDLLFWLAYKEAKALLQPQAPVNPATTDKK